MGLVRRIGAPALTYSMRDPGADLFADEARTIAGAASGDSGAVDFITEFTPVFRGERLAPVRLRVPGRHNVANALGVMLTALEMGCAPERIASALGAFGGARRRFEVKGAAAGVTVIDDYAHHPTEIRATLAAARSTNGNGAGGRVVAVFQPHRYSRTAKMAVEFGEAFAEADLLVITDVYGAGEDPIEGVTGCAIWERAVAVGHPDAHYLADARQAAAFLQSKLRRGDMMLTMGAGDIWRAGEELLALLRQSDSASLMSAASTSSAKSAAVAARQRKPRPRKPIRPESAHAPRRAN
jgi:UDP-N-acetylmuramate--alanine ligase